VSASVPPIGCWSRAGAAASLDPQGRLYRDSPDVPGQFGRHLRGAPSLTSTDENVHMTGPRYWMLRSRLGPRGRRLVRRAVDVVLAPLVGSIHATGAATRAAITFDDGPDSEVTPRLLDALDALDARCTFFVLATQARAHPELLLAVRDAGHEIALHGDDHRRLTELDHRSAVRVLRGARHELEQITGVRVRYYRPPYGAQTLSSYLAARRAGLRVAVWNADAADWRDRPVGQVVADGVDALTAGGILLLHERLEPDPRNGAPTTSFDRSDLARQVVEGVRARGWEPGTLHELVMQGGARRTAWFRP